MFVVLLWNVLGANERWAIPGFRALGIPGVQLRPIHPLWSTVLTQGGAALLPWSPTLQSPCRTGAALPVRSQTSLKGGGDLLSSPEMNHSQAIVTFQSNQLWN